METPGRYGHVVGQGMTKSEIELSPEERATVLALYDDGIQVLQDSEQQERLNSIVAKLKDTIWP